MFFWEGGAVIYQFNAAVRDSLMDLYTDVESLDGSAEGVHIGPEEILLVLGEGADEIGEVREGHIQLVGLAGYDPVFAFYIGHLLLTLQSTNIAGVLRKVEYADILYVEGMKDYLMVHLRSQKQPLVTHLTMKAAEDMLPKESFMRIHRSFIVNLPQITSVSAQGDLKVGDTLLHVSEGYKEAFDQYLKGLTS